MLECMWLNSVVLNSCISEPGVVRAPDTGSISATFQALKISGCQPEFGEDTYPSITMYSDSNCSSPISGGSVVPGSCYEGSPTTDH
jgi:hypothetical protein